MYFDWIKKNSSSNMRCTAINLNTQKSILPYILLYPETKISFLNEQASLRAQNGFHPSKMTALVPSCANFHSEFIAFIHSNTFHIPCFHSNKVLFETKRKRKFEQFSDNNVLLKVDLWQLLFNLRQGFKPHMMFNRCCRYWANSSICGLCLKIYIDSWHQSAHPLSGENNFDPLVLN